MRGIGDRNAAAEKFRTLAAPEHLDLEMVG